jgi:hypothetical protein
MKLSTLVDIAGVLGFFTGCSSLVWQFWTYHDSRKEKIKGELSIGSKLLKPFNANITVHGLFLNISNHGNTSVYIQNVSLMWGEKKLKKIDSQTTALNFITYPETKEPLKPGEKREYILNYQKGFEHIFREASKQPVEKIWISIKSGKGEILRLKGDKVKYLIETLVK